jgi:repressor LexA
MKSLTQRQQQILELIRSTIDKTGMPPTRADICDHFNFRSPTAAEDHLRALERKGSIELLAGRSRGIRVLDKAMDSGMDSTAARINSLAGLPLIGRVAAGAPILAEQNIEDHFQLDPVKFHPRADYLLKVHGQSMKDVGILDGDLLAVHSTREAHNGQIVVARLEDEVTVKRFHRRGHKITLKAENSEYQPIIVDLRQTEFVIEGLGVGVIRNGSL